MLVVRIKATDLVADHITLAEALGTGALNSALVQLPGKQASQGHGPGAGHESLPGRVGHAGGGKETQDVEPMHFFELTDGKKKRSAKQVGAAVVMLSGPNWAEG